VVEVGQQSGALAAGLFDNPCSVALQVHVMGFLFRQRLQQDRHAGPLHVRSQLLERVGQ